MTYEYRCAACGHQWEAEQKITDPALTQCPKCQAEAAKRQISAAAPVLFQGKGWFKTGGY